MHIVYLFRESQVGFTVVWARLRRSTGVNGVHRSKRGRNQE